MISALLQRLLLSLGVSTLRALPEFIRALKARDKQRVLDAAEELFRREAFEELQREKSKRAKAKK